MAITGQSAPAKTVSVQLALSFMGVLWVQWRRPAQALQADLPRVPLRTGQAPNVMKPAFE
jgi:hypothetical protein